MKSLPLVCLALLVVAYVSMVDAGEVHVHVHEHVSGNDEIGEKVNGYVPHAVPVLPYEVSAEQKRFEDDPDAGDDEECEH